MGNRFTDNDNSRDIRSHSDPEFTGPRHPLEDMADGQPAAEGPGSAEQPQDEPLDRYHYVEDVYSDSGARHSRSRKRGGGPHGGKKKKMAAWKKALIWVGSIIAALLIALAVVVGLLFGRLHIEQVDTSQYVETPADAAGYEVMDGSGVMNVLVIGADRDSDGSEGRSDTMMLISMGPGGKMKVVSFLRDLYVDVPGYGKDRLNAAYSYGGAGMLMQTIENNFRINVDKYLETNFSGFEGIIDAMGGIDITMTEAEAQFINEWKNVGAVAGENHLNGQDALYFARMRKLDSDFGRTTRQRQVVSAMFRRLKSSGPITMYRAAYQLMPNLRTNLSYFELMRFLLAFAGMNDAETLSVPSDGTYYDYTTPEGAMVLVPYLDQNIEMLRAFLYE